MSNHNTYHDMNGQLDQFIDETVFKQMAEEAARGEFDHASTFWVTKTGREIPIRQMEDEHLENAFALVQRRPRRFPEATKDALTKEIERRRRARTSR